MTLIEFLRARLDEEEQAAKAVAPLGCVIDMGGARLDDAFTHGRLRYRSGDGAAYVESDRTTQAHFARHDPARVLADVDAKRRIVELHGPADGDQQYCKGCGASFQEEWMETVESCPTKRLLALPYAGHPDYDPAWRP